MDLRVLKVIYKYLLVYYFYNTWFTFEGIYMYIFSVYILYLLLNFIN